MRAHRENGRGYERRKRFVRGAIDAEGGRFRSGDGRRGISEYGKIWLVARRLFSFLSERSSPGGGERQALVSGICDQLALDRLEVHTKDFLSKELKKSAVDLVYLVRFLNVSGTLPLAIILEHKAQSSRLENASTLVQTLGYVVSYCRDQVKEWRAGKIEGSILQPIPIVIYTGRDVNLRGLNWEDSFHLPKEASPFSIKFPLRFLNMTSLCQEKKFEASPFLSTAYNLMALASLGKLEGAESTALAPLKEVREWGPREYDLLHASVFYFLRNAINAKIPVDNGTVETLFASVNQGDEETMKSVWTEIGEEIAKNEKKKIREEGVEEGIERGRLETLKRSAASMRAGGLSDDAIAQYLQVDVADVRIWLDSCEN